jgi:outer membrane protein assembly factor BamD (BamD/ComL family)
VITLDPEGKEHHRTVGFLPPEELIPSLMLGIAKSYFDQEKFGEALTMLDKLLKEYPRSYSAPEAAYVQGVSKYKSTHDPKQLKAAYEKLQAEYPSSEWTKRTLSAHLKNVLSLAKTPRRISIFIFTPNSSPELRTRG